MPPIKLRRLQIAELYDKVAARWEVVAHDVWLIVSLRAWRASSLNFSLRGFEPRKGGGGRFLAECPLCFEQSFEAVLYCTSSERCSSAILYAYRAAREIPLTFLLTEHMRVIERTDLGCFPGYRLPSARN